ncbi:helix-turn-helix domain-containing protein [Hyphomicrobium sp.]|uniref:helix-turn-helix domain-containing protein n=1 Tax=Hyphomicrobium sp. TaxID=82 RepID=UPI002E372B30|nr:helix-turn-helix domain-containing protein [Hyphomicrobium sp.]HEX2842120.1 helix-turn-helix domain-containing protein [Hyphomicrobium sp.]
MAIPLTFNTPGKIVSTLAHQARSLRLEANFTQKGLARHAGVSYASLRTFERSGQISLLSFVKIVQTLGREKDLLAVLSTRPLPYQSIDDVVRVETTPARQRGRRS